MRSLLDFLFPIKCLGCGKNGNFICLECLSKIDTDFSLPAQYKKRYLRGIASAGFYNNPLLQKAVHHFKYDFVKSLAQPLGQLMVKKIKETNLIRPIKSKANCPYVLISVALHQKRLRWRGFNQAELLAIEISQKLEVPLVNDLLIRVKDNQPQATIKNSLLRRKNIKGAFAINPKSQNDIKNKIVFLIDDVSTTGATLNECSRVLKPLKPKEIWGLVAARG